MPGWAPSTPPGIWLLTGWEFCEVALRAKMTEIRCFSSTIKQPEIGGPSMTGWGARGQGQTRTLEPLNIASSVILVLVLGYTGIVVPGG